MTLAGNTGIKPLIGEVVENPLKSGINLSNKVLKITRPDNSELINSTNAANYTTRGVEAHGYDLRISSTSTVEFKYFKDTPGSLYLRIIDGNGKTVGRRYFDSMENTSGYTTAQWRTAQVAFANIALTNFNFSPSSGYLLLSIENEATEIRQSKELTFYVDDIKLLPLSTSSMQRININPSVAAFFDPESRRISVANLPEKTIAIRLIDLVGRVLQDVRVSGDFAQLECPYTKGKVYIVQAILSDGSYKSVKLQL